MGNSASNRKRVKVEEQYTRPQGLYGDRERDVDAKKLRRLILDGKLAPCYPGLEEARFDLEECPICFLHYPSLNRSRCCGKGICTECFLQMKSPIAARPTQCPFCKTPGYAVEHGGPKNAAQKALEQAEEQRVIMATLRMRQEEQAKAEERAKKREKDLSEGRVPDPPSPTLFPPPAARLPAFPPSATSQSPQNVNTPQNQGIQSPASGSSLQGSADRGGSGGGRRRNSTNRRVSAIEPDNLWFRAGSAQGSASNSRRNSTRGGQPEASTSSPTSADFLHQLLASTAESRANPSVTPGDARASENDAVEQREDPMAVLSAIARSDHDDAEMDLDDVMLNEAIWLSLQEEEDRQRRSSQSLPDISPAANLTPEQTAITALETRPQTQGYVDPDEAAASELAKAIAASLEESTARGGDTDSDNVLHDGGVVGEGSSFGASGLRSGSLGGELLKRGGESAANGGGGFWEATAREGASGVQASRGPLPMSGRMSDASPRSGKASAKGLTSQFDAVASTSQSESLIAVSEGPTSGLLEATNREPQFDKDEGTGAEQAQTRTRGGERGEGKGAMDHSTGPGNGTTGLGVPWYNAPSAQVNSVSLEVGQLEAPVLDTGRLPLFGQLRADSVYRSVADVGVGSEGSGGLVSSALSPVEPFSLDQSATQNRPRSSTPDSSACVRKEQVTGPGSIAEKAHGGAVSGSGNVSAALEPTRLLGDPSWQNNWDAGPSLGNGFHEKEVIWRGSVQSVEGGEDRGRSLAGQESGKSGGRARRSSLENVPWEGLANGGGFTSHNPFAEKQSVDWDLRVPKSASPRQFFEGSGSQVGCQANAPFVERSNSQGLQLNPKGINGDLYPSRESTPAVRVEKIGGLEPGTQVRRVRSLSGMSSSASSEPWTSSVYSPVKYPPARESSRQAGTKDEPDSGRAHRQTPSSRAESISSKESVGMHMGTKEAVGGFEDAASPSFVSDSTFEEQLAAAIALSLAQSEADKKRRKEQANFEREAFVAPRETKSGQASC